MTTALALPLAPLIGAGGTLARGTGLVLLTTTKLSPLALLTLLLVLRIQSVPADVDRDHGPVAAVRWLLSYLLPAPGLGWLRRGSARLGRWAADRFAAARGRSRPPPPPLPRAAKRRRSSRPVNVLCMDGGGMRGRNLLVIAEEMELQTGKPLSSLFELVAGTSIGGCGALFLNKYPAPGEATHMARRALRMLQERCFAPDARSYGHLWRDGHLCLDRRREFMLELCGTRQPLRRQRRWLSSSWNAAGPRAFAVASCRRRGGGLEPFLFRTYRATPANLGQRVKRRRERQRRRAGEGGEEGAEAPLSGTSEAEMWQAVEATSAAPSIFPRTRFGGRSFADGGLVANNPTLIALREARALWPHRRIGVVVSLGTGSSRPASTTAVPEAVAELAPGASYFRIEPPSSGVSMIESDEDKLQQMEAATQLYLRSSPVARELCRTLVFQQWWDLIADVGYAVHAWCRDLFPRMDS